MNRKLVASSLFSLCALVFFLTSNLTSSAETCECTNGPFSGGSACTGGTCDGCHCDYSKCTSNCACATNTVVGSTCSNGCGGTCNGTKTGGTNQSTDTSYRSIYQLSKQYSYDCDASNNCKTTDYTGFHDQNNPNNPIVYHESNASSTGSTYSTYNATDKNNAPMKFRVFIAPGSKFLNISMYIAADGSKEPGIAQWYYPFVARLGQPPTGSYSNSYFLNLSDQEELGMNTQGFSIPDIKDKDFVGRNAAGILSIGVSGGDLSAYVGQWIYVQVYPISGSTLNLQVNDIVGADEYKKWFSIASWDVYGDPIGSGSGTTIPTLPTGPDCASKVCLGNSCYNGTTWISGVKITDCASGVASMNPPSVTPIIESTKEHPAKEIAYLNWDSINVSKLEVACTGPTIIPRFNIQSSSALWQADAAKTGDYIKPAGSPDGYPGWFHVGTIGTEICTFYPTNKSDNLPGTPFSATVQVLGIPTCGNNIVEGTEECDYTPSSGQISYVPCPTGKTCQDCKCVATPTKATNNSNYVCQPDNANCAKDTCHDVYCNDGCNMIKGTNSCLMFPK